MTSPPNAIQADVLMRHGRFVRALARSLLADEHAAEEVAQETWVRYLERPPRSALDPRGWLAAVTRNLASNARRDRAARADRERGATLAGSATDAKDEPAQAEVLRSVVDAVLALDEPYRSTVLARYFGDKDPAHIASEVGVPVATVKSRLQRALAMLRERLDRMHGGRASWGLALASLSDLGRVATSATIWKLAIATAILAIPALVVWKTLGSRPPAAPAAAFAAVAGESPTPIIENSAAESARSSAVADAASPRTLRISGTVRNLPYEELGLAGGPAAGVTITVPIPKRNVNLFQLEKATAETRADGSFELEVPLGDPGEVTLTLLAKADDVWRNIFRQERVGEGVRVLDGLALTRGAHGILHGVVVDAAGTPRPGSRVRLRASIAGEAAEDSSEFASDEQGSFRIPWRTTQARAESLDPSTTVLVMDHLEPREAGGWEPARIVLASAAALRVRVVDGRGEGIGSLNVSADLAVSERRTQGIPQRMFREGKRHGQTDERGEVEIDGVWAAHHLELSIGNHSSSSQLSGDLLFDEQPGSGEPIVLAAGEVRTLVARWRGDLRITGRALTAEGQPVPDVVLEVNDLGTDPFGAGTGETLASPRSDEEGRYEARLRTRTFVGPLKIVAKERKKPKGARGLLREMGYAGSSAPTDGAMGTRTVALGEAVDGVLRADVVIEPSLSITGRLFDAHGNLVADSGMGSNRFWAVPAGASYLETQRNVGEIGFGMGKDGSFTFFGLQKGDWDLYVSEEISSENTFYTWSSFLHRFPGIPAGSQGIELRIPERGEVRVKIRTHGEGVEQIRLLHGKLFPRDMERTRRPAPHESRIGGVENWPVRAVLDFTGCSGAATGEGSWAYGFYATKELVEHALPPIGAGWYVFGIHPVAAKGERKWFPQATEPRWYEPGEYTIDFDVVPTTTISGRILADATREHLAVELATESGARIPLEVLPGGGDPSHVLETDAAGRFVIRHAPVGRFRLRAGSAAELGRGEHRAEVQLEVGLEGVSGLEIRF